MNPDSVIEMKDVTYSFDLSLPADKMFKVRFLKDRDESVKPYQPSVSPAQRKLHDSNPVLKDLWEQYATMVKLVQE